ncbi:Sec7 domain-containing protein, partial [Lobosporangium transversale]
MSEGHPTIDSRFQVKEVIELKKISLSLTRDKYDSKNGEAGPHGNRKIPPILAEFIHTFDQDPNRAIKSFIQKRALHSDHISVAHLLFKTPELSKSQLALFLSDPANKHVYRAFLDQCQFAGVLLDEALRTLLSRLSLPDRVSVPRSGGSTDRSNRCVGYLLEEFTKRWYEANINVVVFDASIAHKLVIAMIVLNAQLHNNEGASLVKDRDEPTKDSFVENFQLLDQQRIVPRDTLHNIFLSISHQPLDIDSEKLDDHPGNSSSIPSSSRKLWPIMMSPVVLPPRLTLKVPSDSITITIPVLNPHFSIHLGGRDLKCEPSILEFGSHRSQQFRIIGSVPGKKTLTIQPKITAEKGTPEQYYDLHNLPSKHVIAIERQFMRHTFQISLLNDLGTRRRYLFGASTGVEKDEWARAL